ncbi:MAG: alpha/beta fold hydrolase [Planctomycetota bacterium]|nr:alpha/beta fold hydrolase [Planctomycetota bacterium]
MVDVLGQELPSRLRENTRWERLGETGIPAMLVHPDWNSDSIVPWVLWMHGRTVSKEIDPGRYLRLMRAGIGVCAVDLPGHGERIDANLQQPEKALDVVSTMIDEIDQVVEHVNAMRHFDSSRIGIGGMSAGGMATLARLCHEHTFCAASVEATTGSWISQRKRKMFNHLEMEHINQRNPMEHLEGWREIPMLAIHAIHDEWVNIDGQRSFLDALKSRYTDPSLIEFIEYDRTGAPNEHAGFGKFASDAKNRQTKFFVQHLS